MPQSNSKPFRFIFVLLPRFNSLTLAGLIEPLRIANYCAGATLYEWQLLSPENDSVKSSVGFSLPTAQLNNEAVLACDAVIICGGWNAEKYHNLRLFRWLKTLSRRGIKLGAVETGTYILARAKLLTGYRAAIHWHCSSAFKEQYPDVELCDQLVVFDRNRMTCAGGAACLDMMLRDIEKHHGKNLAQEVSEQLIYSNPRNIELPQKNPVATDPPAPPVLLQSVIDFMNKNIEEPKSIPQVAAQADVSQRKLERLFKKHFDCSATNYYRMVRLQQARALLTQTEMSVMDICIACGFTSSSYFSKSYAKQFGMRPRDHRTAWPESDIVPSWPGLSSKLKTLTE
jgi:AraC family carnitine catabolism transcriptional activator